MSSCPRGGSRCYARPFFDLQLRFARTASVLSGLPLADALLQYTNLYARFGLGRAFDPSHPGWRAYVAGLARPDDLHDWTYGFYLARSAATAPAAVARFGCFSYASLGDIRLRLHFENVEPNGGRPLAAARYERRMAELAALFAHVKRTIGQPVTIVGASWLYNLHAYRRLFPASYLATARVLPGRFQHMPLWGQFVNRRGEVNADRARPFLDRLRHLSSAADLDRCFPLPVLGVQVSARDFYEFHRV